jgi:Fe-S-cluster containining protein
MSHPCQSCGACCAAYRVSFHWFEAEPAMGAPGIPAQLTEAMDPHRLVMRGTWAPQPRCVALQGEVGTHAHCSIYPQRPSPCRELQASWESGVPSPHCDKARARHGLPPLTPEDWQRDAA